MLYIAHQKIRPAYLWNRFLSQPLLVGIKNSIRNWAIEGAFFISTLKFELVFNSNDISAIMFANLC